MRINPNSTNNLYKRSRGSKCRNNIVSQKGGQKMIKRRKREGEANGLHIHDKEIR